MDTDIFLQKISERSGYDRNVVDDIYRHMLGELAQALGRGETVPLLPEWGTFSAKLRKPALQQGSPRTAKKPYYQVVFRVGKEFEKELWRNADENR